MQLLKKRTPLIQFLEIGRSYFQEEQGLKFLEAVINYILQSTEIATDNLVKSIAGITKKGGEIAMTTAEKLRQEGLQKGRQEGLQAGISLEDGIRETYDWFVNKSK